MGNEIQLITDGDGLAVIGDATDVERFLASEGLPSKDLGLGRLPSVFRAGAATMEVGSQVSANYGRWVKLTEESAAAMKRYPMMKGSTPGVSRAVVTENGKIKGLLEVVKTPGSLATNPALLAGAAGLMAQLAMQQTMDEITDYLEVIDKKLDDVLRAQKDGVLADMLGVGLVIDEAMTIREQVGRVSEVTWSKVQATSATLARTQTYALRQLDALGEKLEQKSKVGDVAEVAKEAEATVNEWLAVLAQCFRLQDAVAVLELDRVLDASPDELDQHRLGLRTARQRRLELISNSTEHLLARIEAAAGMANAKVLLSPVAAPAVVRSSNRVAAGIHEFCGRLEIESGYQAVEARPWGEAAGEVRDRLLETGADGVGTARRIGSETLDRAGSVSGRALGGIAERARRRRGDEDGPPEGSGPLDEL